MSNKKPKIKSMNQQNIANLTAQYQQAYLVYCFQVMQYLQAIAWLTEQQNQATIIKVKPKSASGVKKLANQPHQQKPTLKSLKHQKKPDVSTIVAMGFPNGAMSAAFRVAFNDALSARSERQKNADKFVQDRYGDILAAGNINLEDNMEAAKSLSTSDFIDRVKSGGIWDFKSNNALVDQFDPKLLDEFGNFHFGMVAAAQNFSLNSTVSGAGAYQAFIQSGGNKLDSFISITSSFAVGPNTSRVRREITSGFSFGDNPGDSFNIMLGWDYFHINQTDTFHR